MSKYKVCGYDMDLLHLRQLEIAKELDKICRENNIKYSLYGGSIIGAIRHKGFVPWDHDIDIAMPRKDYERFQQYCLEKENKENRFFFSTYITEPEYPNNWGKFRSQYTVFQEQELEGLKIKNGVFIDVHPIDNIVPALLKIQVKYACFWSNVQQIKMGILCPNTLKKKICRLFTWMSLEKLNRKRDKAMRLFENISTDYVYKIAHPNGGIYPIPRYTFEELMECQFEDATFFIPQNYDEFLRKRYGDYMKIPPESQEYECCTTISKCEL